MVFLKMKVSLQILLALVGPTVYIVQFAMKLMWQAMKAYDYLDKMPVVSEERIREELTKCFKCNSSLTLGWLSELTDLRDYIFKNTNLWLKPTSEK